MLKLKVCGTRAYHVVLCNAITATMCMQKLVARQANEETYLMSQEATPAFPQRAVNLVINGQENMLRDRRNF